MNDPRYLGCPAYQPRTCEKCGVTFHAWRSLIRKGGGRFCSKKCTDQSRLRVPIAARFWDKVDKTKGPRGCWPWLGSRSADGYGRVRVNGRVEFAHRVAWELARGALPTTADVCHHCDNPPCANVLHLFLGDAKANSLDARRKGRLCCGSRHYRARLSERAVADILRRLRAGARVSALAREYGVSHATMSNINTRTTWKHVTL